jgi:hypothetical protein
VYEKQTWEDAPSTATPVTADRLNHMEDGIEAGVAATILDAKGDLIAASAADTAAKVTVGADGTVLIADSAQTAGLKWSRVSMPGTSSFGAANRLVWRFRDSTTAIAFSGDGAVLLVPLPLWIVEDIDTIGFFINVGGASGALVRCAIYDSLGTSGKPGNLVVDAGTVAATSTGWKEVAFSHLLLPPDLYWIALAEQGAPATHVSVGGGNGITTLMNNGSVGDYAGPGVGFTAATGAVTGAFPSTWSASLTAGPSTVPCVALKTV